MYRYPIQYKHRYLSICHPLSNIQIPQSGIQYLLPDLNNPSSI